MSDYYRRLVADRHPEIAHQLGRVVGISPAALAGWRAANERLGIANRAPRTGSLAAMATATAPNRPERPAPVRPAPEPVDHGAAMLAVAATLVATEAVSAARRDDAVQQACAAAYSRLSGQERARLRRSALTNRSTS